jgi:AhpC/TSA family
MVLVKRIFSFILLCFALAAVSIVGGQGSATALEVGQPAPDFKLPSTAGVDMSLSDFRGKKWVLLEFYGHDFVPT